MAILPKVIYKSNRISVKLPVPFFTEIEKKLNTQIAKAILSKKEHWR